MARARMPGELRKALMRSNRRQAPAKTVTTCQKSSPSSITPPGPASSAKARPDAEPSIDLDTMLDLTAKAEVDGVKFDGVDLFLFAPHVDIDSSDDDLKHLADKVRARNLVIGSVVAPVWPPTGGGSAMGGDSRSQEVRRTGAQGLPHRQAPARTGRPAVRHRPHRLGRQPRRLAQGSRRQPEDASPRRSARPATSPPTTASAWPPRAKSAGAACTAGSAWCNCSS